MKTLPSKSVLSLSNKHQDNKQAQKDYSITKSQSLRDHTYGNQRRELQQEKGNQLFNKLKTKVMHLDIDRQSRGLKDKDVEELCRTLGTTQVQEINLSDNNLSLNSLKILFKFIQKNKTVQRIVMKNNKVETGNKEKVVKEFKKKGVELLI